MKKKIILFVIVFCFATIITSPNFVTTHALDSYCNMYGGYVSTATWFFQNGRVFSALMFLFYDLINFPFDSISFVSAFGVNLCLTGAILTVYNIMSKVIDKKINKIIILILSFTVFYSPLMIEVVMFDEAVIMGLGVLFVSLCASQIYKGGLKHYILAFIFMILSVMCYQGMACFLIPLVILFESTKFKGDLKQDVLFMLKKLVIAFACYGIAFVIDLGIIKLAESMIGEATGNVGKIDLLANISHIRFFLIPESFANLFGYINTKLYYSLTLVSALFAILGIVRNNNKIVNILTIVGILGAACLMSFVPNLFMNSAQNYTAARTILTLTTIPSFALLFVITKVNLDNNIWKICILILSVIIVIIYSFLFYKNTRNDIERYKQDLSYLNTIYTYIGYYEDENHIKVKHIYWAQDKDSADYYSTGYNNGANNRITGEAWAMKCAINDYSGKKYEYTYEEMSDEDLKKYFKNKDYKKFNPNTQLHYEGDTLYLLIY